MKTAEVTDFPILDQGITERITQRGAEFQVFGMTVAKPSHPDMKELVAQGHEPHYFASRIWGASYLLIDYLARRQLLHPAKILEVGCGWGLISHYLAHRYHHDVQITATDVDTEVFPYLHQLGKLNDTSVRTVCASFSALTERSLSRYRLLVGADICYTYSHAEQLIQLVRHAFSEGIEEILLADSGREPFFKLRECLETEGQMEWLVHSIARPVRQHGYILRLRQTGT